MYEIHHGKNYLDRYYISKLLIRKKAFSKRDTLVCLITALAQINPENQCFDVSFFLSRPPADGPHVCPKLHMSTEPQP